MPTATATDLRKKLKPAPRVLTASRIADAIERMRTASGVPRLDAARALTATSTNHPARVYPHLESIAPLLGSDNKVVRWNAMRILADLASIDHGNRLDDVLESYLCAIDGDNMITAANAIAGAARIALAKPHLVDRVVRGILQVERASYATPQCRDIAIGHALDAFELLWTEANMRDDVRRFIERQQENPRPPVARRAKHLADRTARSPKEK